MVNFEDFIISLERIGVADVLLPFILIFTVVFAVAAKLPIFEGEDKKKFRVMIALVMGLGVVIPHVTNTYPSNYDIVNIINQSLPNVSVIVIAIVCGLILLGTFGIKFNPDDKSIFSTVLWVVAVGIIVYIFGSSAGWGWEIPNWLGFLNDPDTQAFLIIAVVFWAVLSFITGEKKKPGDEGYKAPLDSMKDFVKKIQE